jgi:hypothetical protein
MVRGAMTMTQADIYYDMYDRDIYASAGPVHLRGLADAHNARSHRVAAVHIAGDKSERVAVLELIGADPAMWTEIGREPPRGLEDDR